MRKNLLLGLLLTASVGFSQTYDNTGTFLINELITSPPNTDDDFDNFSTSPLLDNTTYETDNALEYFEFRGAPNAVIPVGTYFVALDGEGNPGDLGEVTEVIDLGGMSFGANGLLVMVANMIASDDLSDSDSAVFSDVVIPSGTTWANPYFPDQASADASDANVILLEIPVTAINFKEGTDVPEAEGGPGFELDALSTTRNENGYDGSFQDNGATYMLISASGDDIPVRNDDVDADVEDGKLDGKALNWTIHDSVSIIDGDSGTAYGQIVFVRDGGEDDLIVDADKSPNIVVLNQEPQWYGRQGNSTGYEATTDGVDNDDWFASRINSRSYPDWNLNSTTTRHLPSDATTVYPDGVPLSTFGGENFDFDETTASRDDVIASKFSVYPNPANGIMNIQSGDVELTSVKLINTIGSTVYSSKATETIDVSSLASGVYFLELNTANGSGTKKVVVGGN